MLWGGSWNSALAGEGGLLNRYRCLGFVSLGEPKTDSEAEGLRLNIAEFVGGVPGGVVGATGLRLAWSPIARGGKTRALGSGIGGRCRDDHLEFVCNMHSILCTGLEVSTAGCPRGAIVKSESEKLDEWTVIDFRENQDPLIGVESLGRPPSWGGLLFPLVGASPGPAGLGLGGQE